MSVRIPKYALRKATGQARVCIGGRDIYLGPYGSAESKAEYRRLISDWQLRQKSRRTPNITVGELILLYDEHVKEYYRKNGKQTSEVLSELLNQLPHRPSPPVVCRCILKGVNVTRLRTIEVAGRNLVAI